MDLARVDLMARSGLLKKFSQLGWYPVVVAETARFKKSIQPFESFCIETSIIGWDEKAVLIGHKFFNGDKVFCEAVVRGRFLKKTGGSVSIDELLKEAQINTPKPQLEDWVEQWNKSQA